MNIPAITSDSRVRYADRSEDVYLNTVRTADPTWLKNQDGNVTQGVNVRLGCPGKLGIKPRVVKLSMNDPNAQAVVTLAMQKQSSAKTKSWKVATTPDGLSVMTMQNSDGSVTCMVSVGANPSAPYYRLDCEVDCGGPVAE